VGIHGDGWWRYRLSGQGLVNWTAFISVLLETGFQGGIAVEHEDDFWDGDDDWSVLEFSEARKAGFIVAARFLRTCLPGRLA